MKIRILRNSFIFLALTNIASGQYTYGLKECIGIGLEKNFSILIAKNTEVIAGNNYSLGNAGYLPKLDVTGRYSGTLNNTEQNYTDGSTSSASGSHQRLCMRRVS